MKSFSDFMNEDLSVFELLDDRVKEYYYNPDSCSGGQIVEVVFYYDDIDRIFRSTGYSEQFFDFVGRKCYLYDKGTPDYDDLLEKIKKNWKRFLIGRNVRELLDAADLYYG